MALAVLLLASCSGGADPTVGVSGQTEYRGMGLEGVPVRAVETGPHLGSIAAQTRSGYHGAFRLRLSPGTYRLEASGEVPTAGGGDTRVVGQQDLTVAPASGRVDQVRIHLHKVSP